MKTYYNRSNPIDRLKMWVKRSKEWQIGKYHVHSWGYTQEVTDGTFGVYKYGRWWTITPAITIGRKKEERKVMISIVFLCYAIMIIIQKQTFDL